MADSLDLNTTEGNIQIGSYVMGSLGEGRVFDIRKGDYPIGVRFGNDVVYLTSELKLTKRSLETFINI